MAVETSPRSATTQILPTVGADVSCALDAQAAVLCWDDDRLLDVPDGEFTQVHAGNPSCALDTVGELVCWGAWMEGFEVLKGTFSEVAVGAHHWCALRTAADESGSNVVCGRADNTREDWRNQTEAPSGEFTQIAAGDNHSCGLRIDGSVVCWGKDNVGQADVPSGGFVEVSAVGDATPEQGTVLRWGRPAMLAPDGGFVSVSAAGREGRPCGVRPDGRVVCWGCGIPGEAPAAVGPLVSASVGPRSSWGPRGSCGVRTDGALVCWDTHTKSVHETPEGSFVGVAVLGGRGYCTLGADAAVRCHPRLDGGTPVGEFTKVAAGEDHACAIRVDATVVCWGRDAEPPLQVLSDD